MQLDHDNLNELEVGYKIGKDMLGAEETYNLWKHMLL